MGRASPRLGRRDEGWNGWGIPAYRHVLERAPVAAGTRLLDVGCGAGRFARMAADRGAQVAGLDATGALVEIARERILGAGATGCRASCAASSPAPRDVTATEIRRLIRAPRARVYRALVDAAAVARWRVPAGMRSEVHEFDAREGGALRVSLTYDAPDREGKTAGRTDTYRGRFVRLVPDELVVEVDEFETGDPALRGEMTMTISLRDAEEGTELVAVHDGLPEGLAPADNEAGWREALARLAALVESPPDRP